eukprot:TRINITY_DN10401_c0_g2_i1.p1 TRINITY_DN10401_c0_g2~~TRINITY_DN10401_c0_g2_i1.p1  ORF type:complete len:568 (+),score=62.82 TRINITY_DN10401_c0_g2_i1:120-1706(+)
MAHPAVSAPRAPPVKMAGTRPVMVRPPSSLTVPPAARGGRGRSPPQRSPVRRMPSVGKSPPRSMVSHRHAAPMKSPPGSLSVWSRASKGPPVQVAPRSPGHMRTAPSSSPLAVSSRSRGRKNVAFAGSPRGGSPHSYSPSTATTAASPPERSAWKTASHGYAPHGTLTRTRMLKSPRGMSMPDTEKVGRRQADASSSPASLPAPESPRRQEGTPRRRGVTPPLVNESPPRESPPCESLLQPSARYSDPSLLNTSRAISPSRGPPYRGVDRAAAWSGPVPVYSSPHVVRNDSPVEVAPPPMQPHLSPRAWREQGMGTRGLSMGHSTDSCVDGEVAEVRAARVRLLAEIRHIQGEIASTEGQEGLERLRGRLAVLKQQLRAIVDRAERQRSGSGAHRAASQASPEWWDNGPRPGPQVPRPLATGGSDVQLQGEGDRSMDTLLLRQQQQQRELQESYEQQQREMCMRHKEQRMHQMDNIQRQRAHLLAQARAKADAARLQLTAASQEVSTMEEQWAAAQPSNFYRPNAALM